MEPEPHMPGDLLPPNRLPAKTEEEPPARLTPSLGAPILTKKKRHSCPYSTREVEILLAHLSVEIFKKSFLCNRESKASLST